MSSSTEVQIAFAPEVPASPGIFAGPGLQSLPVTSEDFNQGPEVWRNDTLNGKSVQDPGQIVGLDKTGSLSTYFLLDPIFHALWNGVFRTDAPVAPAVLTASDLSFEAVDQSLNSAAGAFTAVAGQHVFIQGAGNHDGLWRVVTATANKLTLQGENAVTDAAAGPSIIVRTGKLWRNGSQPQPFSWQRSFQDLTVHDRYLGMYIDTFALDFTAGQTAPAKVDLSMVGNGERCQPGSPIPTGLSGASLGAVAAAPAPEFMASACHVLGIFEGGSVVSDVVRSVKLNLSNNSEEVPGLGHLGPQKHVAHDFSASGTFEVEFANQAQLEAVRSKAITSFALALQDTQDRVGIWTVPAAELTGGNPSAGGRNQTLYLAKEFTGVDDGTGTAAQFEIIELS